MVTPGTSQLIGKGGGGNIVVVADFDVPSWPGSGLIISSARARNSRTHPLADKVEGANMSDSFSGYQAEYQQIKQSIQSKLDNDVKRQQGGQPHPLAPSPNPQSTIDHSHSSSNAEQRKATLRRVTMELEEADEIVSNLLLVQRGGQLL